MALALEKCPLGYRVTGPEAVGPHDARVGVEELDGKLRFYVSTISSWMEPGRAALMAERISECVAAIDVLVSETDPDLLHESHLPAVSAPVVAK